MNECLVLRDFVHEFHHLDMYRRELKKFLELRKTASLQYADRINLSEYKQSLVNILDKYIDADGVELLTKQITITDREQFARAIDTLGSDTSKAEAIAAQTKRTITEKMDTDPEFYTRFSMKISQILEKMRLGKLADVAALQQLKLIEDKVVLKKDDALPSAIAEKKGADIFYRNLRDCFNAFSIPDSEYITIVLDIHRIIHQEAIVDWYKNGDVKRRIMNALDDYLYDALRKGRGMNLSDDNMKSIIASVLTLAENNHEIFS
jgi:type I restriction enzyme R subunit